MEYHLLVFVSFRFVHRVWPNSNARRERKNFSNNFRLFYAVAVLLCATNTGISNVCCRLLSSSRHYTTSIQTIRLNVVRHAMMTICHTRWNDFTVYLLVTCSTVVRMSTTTTREHRIVCNCRKIFLPFTMFSISSEYSNSRSRYILPHIVAPEDAVAFQCVSTYMIHFHFHPFPVDCFSAVCVSNFSIHLIWMGFGWRGSSPISVFQIVLLLLPSITVICHVLFSFQNTARRWSRRQPPFKTPLQNPLRNKLENWMDSGIHS